MSGTRKDVALLRKAHPEFTLSDIGKKIGITKQRVSQILISENLPRHSTKYKPKFQSCVICGRMTENKFCSIECRQIELKIVVFCNFCKVQLTVSKKRFLYLMKFRKYFYCSNKCKGLGGQVFRG